MKPRKIDRALDGLLLCGRYQLNAQIGAGGMGTVFLATDRLLQRDVVAKLLLLEPTADKEADELRRRFAREAKALAGIQHPNVVVLHDMGVERAAVDGHDIHFLITEWLQGEDLQQRLRRQAPGFVDALSIIQQAAEGLAAAHKRGLIHRDVKPSNIMLIPCEDSQLIVKIVDFGIALPVSSEKTVTQLTWDGRSPLTPAYASPEQFETGAEIATPSDVYSLGLVAFELMTGTRYADIAHRVALGRDEDLPAQHHWLSLPPRLRAVFSRALVTNPKKRFPDAGEFADALKNTTRLRYQIARQKVSVASHQVFILLQQASRRLVAERNTSIPINEVWNAIRAIAPWVSLEVIGFSTTSRFFMHAHNLKIIHLSRDNKNHLHVERAGSRILVEEPWTVYPLKKRAPIDEGSNMKPAPSEDGSQKGGSSQSLRGRLAGRPSARRTLPP